MHKSSHPKYLYFVGKGGVGKSTCSASTALALAEKKNKTLIVSLDPAHNLSDIFETSLEDKPKEIKENLYAMEINLEQRMEKSLKKTIDMMKNLYTYLNVINLEGMFDTLRFSPGMEEYAVIFALEDIFESYRNMDFIIFDTPPTGLTLRFIALPHISILWIQKLSALRKKILSRRDSLKNILGEKYHDKELPSTVKDDSVFKELVSFDGRLKTLKNHFSSKEDSLMFLLLNPDRLSFSEGRKIIAAFEKFSLPLNMVIINKSGLYNDNTSDELSQFMESFFADVKKKFNGLKTMELPFKDSGTLSRKDMMTFGENVYRNVPL